MNFDLSDEQKLLKRTVRKLSMEVLEPNIKEQGLNKPYSKEFVTRMLKELQPFGFLGTTIPEELGGDGLDVTTYGLIYEELPIEFKGIVGISAAVTRKIAESGSEYHRNRFLPGLLSGDKIGCTCNTEPNVGSNPAETQTTAYLDGDHWVINGTKTFVSNGMFADYLCVVVQFDRSKGRKGMGMIVVDRDETPIETRRIQLMGLEGGDLAELAEIHFDNFYVPKENLLVQEGEGHNRQMSSFLMWRCFIALHANSIAEKALDYSIQYAKDRKQFGKPIGSFQLIQEMLAVMKTDLDASKLLTYRALDKVHKGENCRLETSMAKYFATEMAVRVTLKAIQIHGGYGVTSEFPLERLYRNAVALTIPEGTSEIQKLIIGRELTGFSAFV